ncbi:MAG: KilA-N domain-containing protein [Clostridium sp.]|nr:KilA-N domain-containing protein [Clostridium sp.]
MWEKLHNPDFNRLQFEAVENEAGLNCFVMTPTKWTTQMNAIGIVSKAGRYGGTYAHSDIAMSFAAWIPPEVQLYIMKDCRRLKTDENSRLSMNWNLKKVIIPPTMPA